MHRLPQKQGAREPLTPEECASVAAVYLAAGVGGAARYFSTSTGLLDGATWWGRRLRPDTLAKIRERIGPGAVWFPGAGGQA